MRKGKKCHSIKWLTENCLDCECVADNKYSMYGFSQVVAKLINKIEFTEIIRCTEIDVKSKQI